MRTDLARMKSIALGLLAAAALLYAFASLLQSRHPAWGYVGAFAEAAMVGAIADWFAVVALFRHPMGVPIPHTAIIPNNKNRIGENLATFICTNFLSTEQVLAKLKHFDAAGRLANWLAEPRHAQQVAVHLSAVMRYGLGALDDERVRHFFRATVLHQLEQLDVSRLAGQLLEMLTSDRRHQSLLDSALRRLAAMLDNEALKERSGRGDRQRSEVPALSRAGQRGRALRGLEDGQRRDPLGRRDGRRRRASAARALRRVRRYLHPSPEGRSAVSRERSKRSRTSCSRTRCCTTICTACGAT